MLYKFCPFCQEIKLISFYTITDDKDKPTQFLNQYCDDCKYLTKNELVTDDILNQKKIFQKLRQRVINRIKAAYDLSATECTQLLGVDYPGYKKFLELFFYDDMSWDNINDWEIDHVKPVKDFDLNKLSERKKCFHFTNTKPLFKKDHIKKGNHGKPS